MSDTTFTSQQTVVTAAWLNDVNTLVYKAENVAALRLITTTPSWLMTLGYYSAGDGGAGRYRYDSSDTTTADNGSTVLVTAGGARYKLIFDSPGVYNVRQFGAKGNGLDSDSAAVSAAITAAFVAGASTIYFPGMEYYFDTPITVNFDGWNGLRLLGDGMANYFSTPPGGTRFKGAAGMESIFIFSKTNLTVAGAYSFECRNIFFESGTFGTTGPATAIKNKIGGAPARPFVVEDCGFVGFDKAIVSDLSATGGLITGIAQVCIRKCNFVGNNYSLYANGGLGAVMNLDFSGNNSENGGRIYLSTMAGTHKITDNLLEGQSDSLYLHGGLFTLEIARNYFESNTGFIFDVGASNTESTCYIHNNYYVSCSGATASFSNLWLSCYDSLESTGVKVSLSAILGKSCVLSQGVLYPAAANGIFQLDLTTVPTHTTVPPGALTSGSYVTGGGSAELTPIGTVDVEQVSGNGNWRTPTMSLASGDWLVALAMARPYDLAATVYLGVYDNAFAPLGNTNTFSLADLAVGEWGFVMAWVKVTGGSGGNPQIRWVTAGGRMDFSTTYFYKVASPTLGSTAMYYCLLNP